MLVVLLGTASCAHGRPGANVSNRALEPGPFPVASFRTTLVDASRPTARNEDYPGAPSRTLETQIWYPSRPRSLEWLHAGPPPLASGVHPLIIYSHGFMSSHTEGQYLVEHLASLGYIVAAADFPLTNYFAPGGPNLRDVVNQPGDVTFLIDAMLSSAADPKSRFAGGIDMRRIGVAGVSLGGLTSMLAAFHPKLGDARVSAVVSIAGPNSMLGPAFFQRAPKPFLMIAGDIDAIVPYDANAADLQQRAPYATLVTLHGGSHAAYSAITTVLFATCHNPDGVGCSALMPRLASRPSPAETEAALGGPQAGIIPGDPRPPCREKNLPRSMRPVREQDLVTLAATSFFESVFANSEATREANRKFLRTTLAEENNDLTVTIPVSEVPSTTAVR
jgi:dienelactone hydrolase